MLPSPRGRLQPSSRAGCQNGAASAAAGSPRAKRTWEGLGGLEFGHLQLPQPPWELQGVCVAAPGNFLPVAGFRNLLPVAASRNLLPVTSSEKLRSLVAGSADFPLSVLFCASFPEFARCLLSTAPLCVLCNSPAQLCTQFPAQKLLGEYVLCARVGDSLPLLRRNFKVNASVQEL